MTKTYTVEWTEILSKTATVKADSLEEALELAKQDYINEEVVLGADDFSYGSIIAKDTQSDSQLEWNF